MLLKDIVIEQKNPTIPTLDASAPVIGKKPSYIDSWIKFSAMENHCSIKHNGIVIWQKKRLTSERSGVGLFFCQM